MRLDQHLPFNHNGGFNFLKKLLGYYVELCFLIQEGTTAEFQALSSSKVVVIIASDSFIKYCYMVKKAV